jgi:cell division septation protein DedD
MEDAVAAASTATAATATGTPWEMAAAPATNLVNRDSITAAPAAADDTPAETDFENAGNTAAGPGAMPMDDTSTGATLDSLPPAAAGSAMTAAAAGSEEAPGEVLAEVAATPADSDAAIQDMPPADTAEFPLPEDSDTTVVALAEPEPAIAEPSPAAAATAPAGDWVVNLASYTYKSTAQRKLALFQSKGVTGEIERVVINDKPLYRIRVTGFESSRSARASIPELQETLGLEGAWIARR